MSSTISSLAASATTSPGFEKLKLQSRDLEGVFLNTLMKEMFGSIKTDDKDLGGGFAEQTWRGMQAEQMAGAVSDAGGIGLADSILSELLAVQEQGQPKSMPDVSP
jgi:flagellar protein FlgJ